MANVKFFLKYPKATNETLVCISFRYHNQRLVYSTSQKINPKFWNTKTQKARENRAFPEFPEFNAYLDRLETEIQSFYRQSFVNGELPTPKQMREHLNLNVTFRTKLEPKPEKPTFFQFIDQFIDEQKKIVEPNTWKKYISTFNHLKKFAAIIGKKEFDFNDITLEWFFDFMEYMYAPPLEFGVNHASKTMDIIRQFLNEATEREYNENKAYQSKKFRIPKEPVYDIHLSETELKQLFDLDLSQKADGFRTVRDLFLIGCYTGLRFSDWSKVRPDQIQVLDNVEFVRVTPDKTKQPVSIPLHPIVKTIINKYDGLLPNSLENQPTNRYIKELGEMAAIDQMTVLVSSKAGKRIDIQEPKYKFIGTHTARRSFATNAFLNGVEPILIREITGHKTEKEFLKYIKISSDTKAVLMSKTDFFKTPKTE
jgi:integrase